MNNHSYSISSHLKFSESMWICDQLPQGLDIHDDFHMQDRQVYSHNEHVLVAGDWVVVVVWVTEVCDCWSSVVWGSVSAIASLSWLCVCVHNKTRSFQGEMYVCVWCIGNRRGIQSRLNRPGNLLTVSDFAYDSCWQRNDWVCDPHNLGPCPMLHCPPFVCLAPVVSLYNTCFDSTWN